MHDAGAVGVESRRFMIGREKERWQELCEQAMKEQDPEKLIVLVQEINRLLDAKRNRLTGELPPSST